MPLLALVLLGGIGAGFAACLSVLSPPLWSVDIREAGLSSRPVTSQVETLIVVESRDIAATPEPRFPLTRLSRTDPPRALPYSCSCDHDRILRAEAPYRSGPDVVGLQAFLAAFGFDPGRVDGVYGPKTAAAVRAFQETRGLGADGVLGPRTWVAIGRTRVSRVAQGLVPPPPGRVEIVIDTADRTLTILSEGKPYRSFPVAVGKLSTPTPQGQWEVASKGMWSGGFGTRWIGLNMPWGKYGIHGTNKPWYIGDAVSGGCIRMLNHDVELVFGWVAIGTPVVIVGHPFGPLRNPRRELGPGERGPDVLAVQRRLRMSGFDPKVEDGMYEESTREAVKTFQHSRGLPPTGVVTADTYEALGLYLFE